MSLEEHLSESIRQAKERIYSNASISSPPSQEVRTVVFGESRQRMHSNKQGIAHKDDKSAVANAMKILQKRIAALEEQNAELKEVCAVPTSGQREEVVELHQKIRLKDKQIADLAHENQQLIRKDNRMQAEITDLNERLIKSQQQACQQPKPIVTVNRQAKMQEVQQLNIQLRRQNVRLAQQLDQLEQRNALNRKTIQKMTRQLDEQRRVNLKWIRMHQNQLNDHKQNNSNEINQQERKTSHKKDTHLRGVGLKDLQDKLTRTRAKVVSLTKECKEYQERYHKAQLIAQEIVDNVNQFFPNTNSHIKFLAMRLNRLDSNSFLRSSSVVRRSRVYQASPSRKTKRRSLKMSDLNSASRQGKRTSLKMSDLNSASKIERSVSGSRKVRAEASSGTKSDKKRQISVTQIQKMQVQQQMKEAKRRYRNLTVKNRLEVEESRQTVEAREIYMAKKERLQQLRRLA